MPACLFSTAKKKKRFCHFISLSFSCESAVIFPQFYDWNFTSRGTVGFYVITGASVEQGTSDVTRYVTGRSSDQADCKVLELRIAVNNCLRSLFILLTRRVHKNRPEKRVCSAGTCTVDVDMQIENDTSRDAIGI